MRARGEAGGRPGSCELRIGAAQAIGALRRDAGRAARGAHIAADRQRLEEPDLPLAGEEVVLCVFGGRGEGGGFAGEIGHGSPVGCVLANQIMYGGGRCRTEAHPNVLPLSQSA